MVGDAALREIIGADAFAAIAGTDQRAALFGALLVQLLLLHLVEPAAQDTQGAIVVLVLAALVLALHFKAGRYVPDAHGAFGLVYMLATRAAGAHALPCDVLIADVDLHF